MVCLVMLRFIFSLCFLALASFYVICLFRQLNDQTKCTHVWLVVLLQPGVRGTKGHVTQGVFVQHVQSHTGVLLPDYAAASFESSRQNC